ncbi:similar to Saccharomyces cerevisiae YOL095C HMI1 Mitochondrial inner membrane localized ATP-dependent DNA helicase, required for the maintenance of the mitochondrial genome [Maudiozyma saulgeensis]|uniref:DNA 3'-5' helicase n=1 Tax=Maudiozyma saulgeensis TaxID=1789683 RepID=A0A1X7R880_9SACH|nr:similar to Saccharomyces cerevisiae YOL095C HMI1 Mitochondrial inner membrane localized ATP-dependent DNA helicase, required for the maintenance of the mitochondrial genome [Kazachstania saulgeensis]
MDSELTPSQCAVLEYPYFPANTVKIIAGPGSGKTFTLLQKVHHLITTQQVKQDEILILSLTNKAVDNIKAKLIGTFEKLNKSGTLQDDLQKVVDQIDVFTIHGLANKLVVEHEGIINIIEENGWKGLLKLVSSEFWSRLKISSPTSKNLEMLLKAYKQKTNKGESNSTLLNIIDIMESCKVLTNDDLILKASKYLSLTTVPNEQSEFLNKIKNKYKVVLIDEFQDLYPILLPLIKEVSFGKQLIMFGDSNQSIYDFLGSNQEVMRELDKLHIADVSKTLHLYDNFRSTPEIISASKLVLPHHINTTEREDLVMKSPCFLKPQIYQFNDNMDQMEFIVSEIAKLATANVKLSDIAILSRTNNHLNVVAEYFRNYQIPYNKMITQPDWLMDTRIQFLIDLIKVVVFAHKSSQSIDDEVSAVHRKSDFSVLITLSALKGIGSKSIQTLYAAAIKERLPLWDYILTVPQSQWQSGISNKNKIVDYTNKVSKLVADNTLWSAQSPLDIMEIISSVAMDLDYTPLKNMSITDSKQFKRHLEDMFQVMKLCLLNKPHDLTLVEWFIESFFEKCAEQHQNSLKTPSYGSGNINLSTIHSAKGLEYPVVMLLNSTTDTFSIESSTLYVGVTRARNLLYMININHRKFNKQWKDPNLFQNQQFWKYYNNDLNRPTTSVPGILASNSSRYLSLSNKYGLRTYSTYSHCINRSLFKALRYRL